MNHCETCKYWNRDEAPYERVDKYAQRACVHLKLSDGVYESQEDMLNYAYDEGGAFYTGPKFGCVHWEKP